MAKQKTVKVTIELGEYAHCLWESHVDINMIRENPSRFAHLEGGKRKYGNTYFVRTYLEAKVFQAYIEKLGHKSSLWSDEYGDGDYEGFGTNGRFVVSTTFKGE